MHWQRGSPHDLAYAVGEHKRISRKYRLANHRGTRIKIAAKTQLKCSAKCQEREISKEQAPQQQI